MVKVSPVSMPPPGGLHTCEAPVPYFPVTCNPSRAVTLPNIGVPHYIGVPHPVTSPSYLGCGPGRGWSAHLSGCTGPPRGKRAPRVGISSTVFGVRAYGPVYSGRIPMMRPGPRIVKVSPVSMCGVSNTRNIRNAGDGHSLFKVRWSRPPQGLHA